MKLLKTTAMCAVVFIGLSSQAFAANFNPEREAKGFCSELKAQCQFFEFSQDNKNAFVVYINRNVTTKRAAEVLKRDGTAYMYPKCIQATKGVASLCVLSKTEQN